MDYEKLEALREALKTNADFTSRREDDLVGDYRLHRFLQARNNDIEKAKIMVEDHLVWRKEHELERLRAHVIDKPFLVSSFPHYDELKKANMGMIHVIVNGGRSRMGDVVHVESIGGTAHVEVPPGQAETFSKFLFEHYFGFFERRSIYLESLSASEKKFIRCLQIRDVSQLSLMPHGGVFSVIRKILKSGLGKSN